MGDRMEELKDQAKSAAETAGVVARYAGKKASAVMNVTKRKVKRAEVDGAIRDLLRETGELVYLSVTTGESREEALSELMDRLDEKYEARKKLDEEIEELLD